MKTDINWDRVILAAVTMLCLLMSWAMLEIASETQHMVCAQEVRNG